MPVEGEIFGKKNEKVLADNFWKWFASNKDRFSTILDDSEKVQQFLDELIGNMKPFNRWFKALAGPYEKNKSELIITSDGDISLFCKVEDLVNAAPPFDDWLITAHKPPLGLDKVSIKMYDREFSSSNMKFYPYVDANYPDEINIILVHPEFNSEEKGKFQSAGIIFLENALGELNTATLIDSYEVKGMPGDDIELIPLDKLEEYLRWREKEFIEKYEKLEARKPEDSYGVLESEDSEGRVLYATINAGFKNWEFKAAFPWCVQIDIEFKGQDKGLPDKKQVEELQEIENELLSLFGQSDLAYVGHQTHNDQRTIFCYSSDYNTISKKIHRYLENTGWDYEITFFIRKDKYWRNMEWFFNATE